ncbi:hypothetical protein BH20ACI2_BH20ACI2_22630 [soil metagenome]
MTQRPLFVFCLIFLMAGTLAAQRTVTNASLERYKQDRLKAQRDYRENYERLGMPSPEELERRREKSMLESAALSARLRAERLEEERRLLALQVANSQFAAYTRYSQFGVSPYYNEPLVFLSSGRYQRYYGRRPVQQGYFAGGQFWSTGSRTASRPIVRTVRPVRIIRPRR